MQLPTSPLAMGAEASQNGTQIAGDKTPSRQTLGPDTAYPWSHVGWHVNPLASTEVQLPTAPLAGGDDASQGGTYSESGFVATAKIVPGATTNARSARTTSVQRKVGVTDKGKISGPFADPHVAPRRGRPRRDDDAGDRPLCALAAVGDDVIAASNALASVMDPTAEVVPVPPAERCRGEQRGKDRLRFHTALPGNSRGGC